MTWLDSPIWHWRLQLCVTDYQLARVMWDHVGGFANGAWIYLRVLGWTVMTTGTYCADPIFRQQYWEHQRGGGASLWGSCWNLRRKPRAANSDVVTLMFSRPPSSSAAGPPTVSSTLLTDGRTVPDRVSAPFGVVAAKFGGSETCHLLP